jgi:hypothetical protein
VYGRHFSDVIDVKARRSANIDSEHMIVFIKLWFRINQTSNTTSQHLNRLNDGNVATVYHHELEAELPGASEPEPLSVHDKQKRIEKAVQKVATNIIDTKTIRREVFRRELRKG